MLFTEGSIHGNAYPPTQFCDHLLHGLQDHDKGKRELVNRIETLQGWFISRLRDNSVSIAGLNQSLQILTH